MTTTAPVPHEEPVRLDEHGVRHHPRCTRPGWVSDRPAMRGWHVVVCAGCRAVRLVRAGATTHPERRKESA